MEAKRVLAATSVAAAAAAVTACVCTNHPFNCEKDVS
jgi:hypothetical protein